MPDPSTAPPPAHEPTPGDLYALNRSGVVATNNGHVHRPTRDLEPAAAPAQSRDAVLLSEEHEAIHVNSRPLARLKARAEELQHEVRALVGDPEQRAKLNTLRDEAEQLERERTGAARGSARTACLTAIEAQATRAASDYVTAASIVAEAAARYEAAAQLHDRLLGLNRFDGLGCWRRDGKLLAPEPRHRPRSLRVVHNGWSGDGVWSADSAPHLAAVEANITKLSAELQHGLNGSGWPF